MAANLAAFDAPTARAKIAHQVAGILVGSVDLDMHHGFEERGTCEFHGFLERKRSGDFESDVGRIDVVIFAVVQSGAEIGHWKPGEKTAHGRFANATFDRRNPIVRNGAAENIVDEFDSLVTLGRFKFYAAYAELAVAAGLFFVLAFDIGAAANGFAIGNLRRL